MIRVRLLQSSPLKKFRPRNLWCLCMYVMLPLIQMETWFLLLPSEEVFFAHSSLIKGICLLHSCSILRPVIWSKCILHTSFWVTSMNSITLIQNWSLLQKKTYYHYLLLQGGAHYWFTASPTNETCCIIW